MLINWCSETPLTAQFNLILYVISWWFSLNCLIHRELMNRPGGSMGDWERERIAAVTSWRCGDSREMPAERVICLTRSLWIPPTLRLSAGASSGCSCSFTRRSQKTSRSEVKLQESARPRRSRGSQPVWDCFTWDQIRSAHLWSC